MAIVKIPEHQLDLTQTTAAISAANAAISAETTARQNADSSLQSDITAEQTARQNAVSALQSGLSSETASRQAADTTLQSNINAEASARQTADNTLSTNKLDKSEAASTYATQTSVSSALALKQSKTLDTSLTIGGVSQTTVEGALGALNTFVETKKSGVVFRTWED